MDPYDMPKELRNLAAQNMGKIGAMQDLLHGIEKLTPQKTVANENERIRYAANTAYRIPTRFSDEVVWF